MHVCVDDVMRKFCRALIYGVEKMLMFRPKNKKTDGDVYVKELVHQIKASKETLKEVIKKKDFLVDACHQIEEGLIQEVEVAMVAGEANAMDRMDNSGAAPFAATTAPARSSADAGAGAAPGTQMVGWCRLTPY
jgi:hypothetical protein